MRTYGLTLGAGRGILAKAAEDGDVALARELEKGVEQWVKTAAGRRKRLGRRQFDQMVATYETGANGELSKDDDQEAGQVADGAQRRGAQARRSAALASLVQQDLTGAAADRLRTPRRGRAVVGARSGRRRS